ncbi:MAG: toll/interleukin-1 receptor domain-containing protein, partial [Ignavibacteria bacterium]|nr:toll/interleukin-1 receptor domain-containing protein [Ignavibacteria bacterium]
MKIFISWSGKRSRETAVILRDWLPQVIQAVEPWISPDIEKGKRWSKEITDNLEQSNVGIICLNRDNLHEDWIHFEAGALSKTKDALICTFLLDVKPSDVEEPLAQFQHTLFTKDDIKRLVMDINKKLKLCGEKQLPEKTLENVFNTFWPEFENNISTLLKQGTLATEPIRDLRDIVEEILGIVRGLDRNVDVPTSTLSSTIRLDGIKFDKKRASRFEITIQGNTNDFGKMCYGLRLNGLDICLLYTSDAADDG